MENNNVFSIVIDWVKAHVKIIAIVAAVVVLAIILINVLPGGPKKTVKKYINAVNSRNAAKYVKLTDFVGQEAWKGDSWYGSSYDVDDFEKEDYEEFIEAYEDVDKDEFDKDYIEEQEDKMDDYFDDIDDDFKKYKVKLEEIKKVEELGKDLYAVKAKVSILAVHEDKDVDEIDESSVVTFVVYKNKIISGSIL